MLDVYKTTGFPLVGMKKRKIRACLKERLAETPRWDDVKQGFRLGFPQTRPNKTSVQAYKLFLEANTNNVGMHTRQGKKRWGTHALELETIKSLSALYRGDSVEGYITSGGTEGNIMALWIARNMFDGNGKTCLLKTRLTHYSISKAVDLLALRCAVDVDITPDYVMSIRDLKSKIDTRIRRGFRNVIIVATVGYVATGTVDPIEGISNLIESYKRRFPWLRFFLHVDAAYGGFVLPFSSNKRRFGFDVLEVKTLVTDPHKMGLVPYPAGVFLCRKNLTRYISACVDYSGLKEDTLLGSRPGTSAAACWAAFAALGSTGYTKILNECLEVKEYLISKLHKLFPDTVIISDKSMNLFAIQFSSLPKSRLPARMEKKYRLVPAKLPVFVNNASEGLFYKIYVMPHVKKSMADVFLKDLSACTKRHFSYNRRSQKYQNIPQSA